MALTGKKFPSIDVNAVNAKSGAKKINVLKEAFKGDKKVLLLWYPKDFTAISSAELFAFEEALSEFEKRNTTVIAASCDTPEAHAAWLNTPKKQGGIKGITFSILSDSNRNLAGALNILDISNKRMDERIGVKLREGENVSYRAAYLLDEEGTVIHEGINHMPLMRNAAEYLRIIDAYTHFQEKGEIQLNGREENVRGEGKLAVANRQTEAA